VGSVEGRLAFGVFDSVLDKSQLASVFAALSVMAATNTMTRPTRYAYAMTLRLEPRMESALADLAFDLTLSKAGAIRRILHRAIADAHQHELPITTFQAQGGGR